ncbi:MAG: UDP-N-acetylmuramoyl-tripeptide--D-alanyl-D-alanine ligase [Campylobacter sp.]|nr:UDP-N-acetylmuramoyl-tripeptide--D-alanyl-D-alanine ligase [Campylobacter sp.]
MKILLIIVNLTFILTLGFYLITTLQWFSYKFERVLFHFTKPIWHVVFLIIPLITYAVLNLINPLFFIIYLLVIHLPLLILWHKKLDKKLVFTPRVKRFFILLVIITLFFGFILINKAQILPIILPLFVAFLISYSYENYNSKLFYKKASLKLKNMPKLTIIMITASYGKTSIKNFLYQILSSKFNCQKTPRSVNTLMGLVKDINENLDPQTQIYIAEAGARLKGDIYEITKFLNPQIVIIGEIGEQHIEYFKSIENIRATKLEALASLDTKKAFVHSSTNIAKSDKVLIYDSLKDIEASLDGLKFSLEFCSKDETFYAPILGKFNALNIAVCIKVAEYLNLSLDEVKNSVANLKSVEHRLEKIEAGKKLIIDDSFNGNFKGMSQSYELVSSFEGRKVIVTPGIVESTKQMNEELGKLINSVFDLVMITGELNANTLKSVIDQNKVIIIKDKANLTEILGQETRAGDLILFSNDAPNFI